MVSPIDPKSNFNREIAQTIADRSNIDNLRIFLIKKLPMKVVFYLVKVLLIEVNKVMYLNIILTNIIKIILING